MSDADLILIVGGMQGSRAEPAIRSAADLHRTSGELKKSYAIARKSTVKPADARTAAPAVAPAATASGGAE